jgi:hypothetical protein
MTGRQHHPQITRRADDRWTIRCPECEQNPFDAIPIGIAMPLETLHMAELILTNHLHGQEPRSRKRIT